MAAGPNCVRRKPVPVQHIHPGPMQRQRLRRIQPAKRRKPTGNPPVRRRHLAEAGGPTASGIPTAPPGILRRRRPRPGEADTPEPVEEPRQRHPRVRVPSEEPRLLRTDAGVEILPVPERIRGGQPENRGGHIRGVRAGDYLAAVRSAVQRRAAVGRVFDSGGGGGDSEVEGDFDGRAGGEVQEA